MHKYIRQSFRQEANRSRISSQNGQSEQRIFSKIRKSYETGQHISQQKLNEMLTNKNVFQRQRIINELLMFGQIKIVQNLIKSKTLNKQEAIDSKKQLKALYETLSSQSLRSKNAFRVEKEDQSLQKSRTGESKQTSMKQLLLGMLRKLWRVLKTINPTHYGIVLGLILIFLCVRKFRSRIIPLLKSLLNV